MKKKSERNSSRQELHHQSRVGKVLDQCGYVKHWQLMLRALPVPPNYNNNPVVPSNGRDKKEEKTTQESRTAVVIPGNRRRLSRK